MFILTSNCFNYNCWVKVALLLNIADNLTSMPHKMGQASEAVSRGGGPERKGIKGIIIVKETVQHRLGNSCVYLTGVCKGGEMNSARGM